MHFSSARNVLSPPGFSKTSCCLRTSEATGLDWPPRHITHYYSGSAWWQPGRKQSPVISVFKSILIIVCVLCRVGIPSLLSLVWVTASQQLLSVVDDSLCHRLRSLWLLWWEVSAIQKSNHHNKRLKCNSTVEVNINQIINVTTSQGSRWEKKIISVTGVWSRCPTKMKAWKIKLPATAT